MGAAPGLHTATEFLGRPVWLSEDDSLLIPIGLGKPNRNQIWQISYPDGERHRFTMICRTMEGGSISRAIARR